MVMLKYMLICFNSLIFSARCTLFPYCNIYFTHINTHRGKWRFFPVGVIFIICTNIPLLSSFWILVTSINHYFNILQPPTVRCKQLYLEIFNDTSMIHGNYILILFVIYCFSFCLAHCWVVLQSTVC